MVTITFTPNDNRTRTMPYEEFERDWIQEGSSIRPRGAADKRDPVVDAVRADLHRRSQLGIAKYGSTLGDNAGDERYWLNHAYEEALDLANYLKRRIMQLDKTSPADQP